MSSFARTKVTGCRTQTKSRGSFDDLVITGSAHRVQDHLAQDRHLVVLADENTALHRLLLSPTTLRNPLTAHISTCFPGIRSSIKNITRP